MAIIGTFSAIKDGYTGTIRTLSINARVKLLANDRKGKESGPDFLLLVGDTEIGVAWRRTKRETEQSYLRVRIDDPAWPQPLWGAMMESTDDGVVRLLWRRDKPEGA